MDLAKTALRRHEQNKGKSPLLANCFDSIDAALWLIAGERIEQSLVMFHHSIEIAFKSELEGIHKVLIANIPKLDYGLLKSLFKADFQAHYDDKITIEDFDIDKTISFDEALKRVKELYPLVAAWEPKLSKVKDLRNEIVHYGTGKKPYSEYVDIIVNVIFPFLEEFLLESCGIIFENVVTAPVYREILVAKKVCERLRKENTALDSFVLNTVSFQMFHNSNFSENIPSTTEIYSYSRAFEIVERIRKELSKEWDDFYIERDCRICQFPSLFVKVCLTDTTLAIVAARCARCNLQIGENEDHLAEYHVGELSQNEIDNFLEGVV